MIPSSRQQRNCLGAHLVSLFGDNSRSGGRLGGRESPRPRRTPARRAWPPWLTTSPPSSPRRWTSGAAATSTDSAPTPRPPHSTDRTPRARAAARQSRSGTAGASQGCRGPGAPPTRRSRRPRSPRPPRRSSQARGHTVEPSPCARLPLLRMPLAKWNPTGEGRRAAPYGAAPVNPTCFLHVSWSKRSVVTHTNYRRARFPIHSTLNSCSQTIKTEVLFALKKYHHLVPIPFAKQRTDLHDKISPFHHA